MSYLTHTRFRLRDFLGGFAVPGLLAVYILFPNFKAGDARAAFLLIAPEHLKMALGLGLLLLCLGHRSALQRPATVWTLFLLWSWCVSLALTLFWSPGGDYALDKVEAFYFHTVVAIITPLWLLEDDKDLERFLIALAGMGLLYGAFVGTQLLRSQATISRYAVGAPNAITVGRSSSIALLLVLVHWVQSPSRHPWKFSTALVLPVLFMGISASRGPIVGCVVALVAWWYFFLRARLPLKKLAKPLALTALVLLLFFAAASSSEIVRRFSRLFTGEIGVSETGRLEAYRLSVQSILTHPFGLGWGGFEQMDIWSEGQKLNYPHNLLLEVALEGGWAAAILFLTFLAVALRRGIQTGITTNQQALFALFIAFFVNSMVSGDLNTNRLFLALTALLAAHGPHAARRAFESCSATAAFKATTTRSTSAFDRLVWKGNARVLRDNRSVTGN